MYPRLFNQSSTELNGTSWTDTNFGDTIVHIMNILALENLGESGVPAGTTYFWCRIRQIRTKRGPNMCIFLLLTMDKVQWLIQSLKKIRFLWIVKSKQLWVIGIRSSFGRKQPSQLIEPTPPEKVLTKNWDNLMPWTRLIQHRSAAIKWHNQFKADPHREAEIKSIYIITQWFRMWVFWHNYFYWGK